MDQLIERQKIPDILTFISDNKKRGYEFSKRVYQGVSGKETFLVFRENEGLPDAFINAESARCAFREAIESLSILLREEDVNRDLRRSGRPLADACWSRWSALAEADPGQIKEYGFSFPREVFIYPRECFSDLEVLTGMRRFVLEMSSNMGEARPLRPLNLIFSSDYNLRQLVADILYPIMTLGHEGISSLQYIEELISWVNRDENL